MTALKTISLRIRGMSEETEELDDDLINISGTVADLTKVASNNFTGVSLFEPGDPNTYRSTYDILKDIAAIWEELTDKNRAELLEALFGKMRANVGAAILSNFEQAEKAMDTMANSAGSAEAEMDKITNSLEYKLNALQETWTGVAQNLFDKELIAGGISVLQTFSNAIDGLTENLGLLGTLGLSVVIANLIRFKNTVSSVTANVAPAFQALANTTFTDTQAQASALKYAVAIRNLNSAEQELVLTTKGVNATQREQIATMAPLASLVNTCTIAQLESAAGADAGTFANKLNCQSTAMLTEAMLNQLITEGTLNDEHLKLIARTRGVGDASVEAAGKLATFKTGLSTMFATPMSKAMAIISIIAIVGSLAKKLYDQFNVTAEEAYDALSETESEIENLQTQLNETKDRLSELQELSNNGTITLAEQEELDKLQLTNERLQRQLELKQMLKAEEADELNKKLQEEYNSQVYGIASIDDSGAVRYKYSDEYIEETIDKYRELKDTIANLNPEDVTDAQIDQLDKLETELLEFSDTVTTDILGKYKGEDYFTEHLNDIIDQIYNAIKSSEQLENAFAKLPKEVQDKLNAAGAEGAVTAQDVQNVANAYTEFGQALTNCGKSAEDYAAHLNSASRAQEETAESTERTALNLTDLSDKLSNLKSYYSALDSAQEDMAGAYGLTADTIDALASADANYLDYLYEENGVLMLNVDAWKERANAPMLGDISKIEDEIAAIEEENKVLRDNIEYYQNRSKTAKTDDDAVYWANKVKDETAILENNNQAIDKYTKQLSAYQSALRDISNAPSPLSSAETEALTKRNKVLQQAVDAVNEYYAAISNAKSSGIEGVDDAVTESYQKLKDTADELGISVDALREKYMEYTVELNENTEALENNQSKESALSASYSDVTQIANNIQTEFDKISGAIEEFGEDGQVGLDTLNELAESFGNLDSYTEFADVLTDASSSMEDVQNAANKLGEEFINNTNILDYINEDTADYIQKLLEMIGVSNSAQVVQERLKAIQLENVLAANDLTLAEWEKAKQFLETVGATEEEISALQRLRQEQYNSRLEASNFVTAGNDVVQSLYDQAKAAGMAASQLSVYDQVLSIKKKIDAEELTMSPEALKRELNKLKELQSSAYIDTSESSGYTYNPIQVKVPKSPSSSSKSSSSSSSKEVEEYTAEIDKYREAVEKLNRVQEERSKIEREIENYNVPKSKADIMQQLGLTESAVEVAEYYNQIQQEIRDKGIDTTQTVFGNINTSVRQVLDWTDENIEKYRAALESWGEDVDNIRGSYSTVMGSSEEFDGVEIAFSPILQTDSGPVLLSSDTLHEYIWGLIDKASADGGWTNEELLRLDTEGLEFDGTLVKNMIADIGDTAIETGEKMHYVGLGAVAESVNELTSASAALGMTNGELLASYQQLQNAIGDDESVKGEIYYLKQRIQLTHELIQTYGQEQAATTSLMQQRSADIEANVEQLRSMGFEVEYNAAANQLWIANLEHINDLVATSAGKYDSLQEATNQLRQDTEDFIDTTIELNYANKDSQDSVNDLEDSIHDARVNIIDDLAAIVDEAHGLVDTIQNVQSTFQSAADEYAENGGFLSIDTYQSLLELGPQYLQYLQDEQGQYVINEEAINRVTEAKVRQLGAENALAYVERIRQALQAGSVEQLQTLLFATTELTSGTFGLAYAEIELMRTMGDLTDAEADAAIHNIEAIESMTNAAVEGIGKSSGAAVKALQEQKEALQDLKSELEDTQDALGDLVQYVMDMLSDRIERQIDAINDQIDAYKELVDIKKESLKATKDEADYQRTVADKVKEMGALQAQISALDLDDSREAQAEKAKLVEELSELEEDLADTQSDHALDAQTDALDAMADAYEVEKNKEIAALEDSISSKEKLYRMA